MQKYTRFSFQITPMNEEAADILTALLADAGFDSFQQTATGLDAYISTADVPQLDVPGLLESFRLPATGITYNRQELEDKDWNEEWETNGFAPIVIPGLCCIHKPSDAVPAGATDGSSSFYDILLQPRMAFGSGTHATTSQLVGLLLRSDLNGQSCLDMGCGTGILAICMALREAARVVAIDIDEASVENTLQNAALNHLTQILSLHGDAGCIEGRFHTIVANIHRNIIIHDLPCYVRHLHRGGRIVVSGFFSSDIPAIAQTASHCGLSIVHQQHSDDWAVLVLAAS